MTKRRQIQLDWLPGDRVKILALGSEGVVREVSVPHGEPVFRVTYWHQGEQKSEWLNTDQLKEP